MALRTMFEQMYYTYDLLNRVLTLGFDGIWRKHGARECASGRVIVDLCCGTGDNTLSILQYSHLDAWIIGFDFSKSMLKEAKKKTSLLKGKWFRTRNCTQKREVVIDFIVADASQLPMRNECIDRIGISFSFRNLVYRNPKWKKCIEEVLRSLRIGGRFVCVETSQPKRRFVNAFYHLYLNKVVPPVGGFISGHKGAYLYLGISALNFPRAEQIANMLLRAGFRKVFYNHMTLGIVAKHVCTK